MKRQPARHRPRAGGAVRDAAPLRLARGAPRGALRCAESRRRGDDGVRRRGRVLGDAASAWQRRGRADCRRRRGGALGSGDGADPRVPHDHAARESDRVGPRADDLRGRARSVRLLRGRAPPRRSPGDPPVRLARRPRSRRHALLRPDPVRPVPARLPLVARDPPGGSLPRANAPRTQRARCGRGSGVGRRDGDRRGAVPVRARARRGRVRRRRRRAATASPSPRDGSRGTCS